MGLPNVNRSLLLLSSHSSTCPVKSASLLAGLLRAHAALCFQDESLACMLGGKGGGDAASAGAMQAVLVARYHLASCLRCYVEAAQPWQVSSGLVGLRRGSDCRCSCGNVLHLCCLLPVTPASALTDRLQHV